MNGWFYLHVFDCDKSKFIFHLHSDWEFKLLTSDWPITRRAMYHTDRIYSYVLGLWLQFVPNQKFNKFDQQIWDHSFLHIVLDTLCWAEDSSKTEPGGLLLFLIEDWLRWGQITSDVGIDVSKASVLVLGYGHHLKTERGAGWGDRRAGSYGGLLGNAARHDKGYQVTPRR